MPEKIMCNFEHFVDITCLFFYQQTGQSAGGTLLDFGRKKSLYKPLATSYFERLSWFKKGEAHDKS